MTDYTVVLGQIGDDSRIFTAYVAAEDRETAVKTSLQEIFYKYFDCTYETCQSMTRDGYHLYGLFEGHHMNFI